LLISHIILSSLGFFFLCVWRIHIIST